MEILVSSLVFAFLTILSLGAVFKVYKNYWQSKIWSLATYTERQRCGGYFGGQNIDHQESLLMKQFMKDKSYIKVETSNGMSLPGFVTEVTDSYFEMKGLTSFRPNHAPEIEEGEEDEHDEAIFASYRISYDMIAGIESDFEIHAGEKKELIEFYRKNVIK